MFRLDQRKVQNGSNKPFSKVSRLSIEKEKEIIRRYKTKAKYPESTREIADLVVTSDSTVQRIVRGHGYKLRPACRHPNPYVNNNAFKDPENNPEAAYWIGFLMADGWCF